MQFDVLKIGDFRFPGGTSSAVAHEIRALAGAGYRVGLVQKRAAVLKQDRSIHSQIQACLDAGQATLVTGGLVSAKLAILHNPYVFTETAADLPRITADRKILVAHQPLLDANGVPYYDPARVQGVAESLVGPGVVWAPISPLSRRNLQEAGLPFGILDEDWTNLIFVEDWAVDRSTLGAKPVIGRHSRPDWPKWPATAADLLTVYPASDEVEVRLLGVGQDLARILGGPYPANWKTFAFNEIEPRDFLATIDFFVYYHHPNWVEGFGRTIAEAAASGAVVILPEHFRPSFGEAALYRQPHEVLDTVRELHADPERYRLQSRLGQRIIDRLYGPARYLKRIEALIGGASAAAKPPPVETGASPAPSRRETEVDIAVLGDFRTARETAWRIANEVRIQAELGYRTALIHHPSDGVRDMPTIHPEIDALVREGLAQAIEPFGTIRAPLLIVHQPGAVFDALAAGRAVEGPRILADRIVVIYDRPLEAGLVAQKNALFKSLFGGRLSWWATTEELRRQLAGLGPDVTVEPEAWTVSVWTRPWKPRPAGRARPLLGRAGLGDETQWPADPAELLSIYPDDDSVQLQILGIPHARKVPLPQIPPGWDLLGVHDISVFKFLGNLDFLVYYPSAAPNEVPVHAIAWALAHGVPAVLPPALRATFGQGPIYVRPQEALRTVRQLHADRAAYTGQSADVARLARQAFGPSVHRARLQKLLPARTERRQAPPASRPARDRVLFLSSNGVGLGHLTRLLAIARRMPNGIAPVFATMSQAMPIVEQAGYPVEYLPFHVAANCDVNDWNLWLEEHLTQILDFHAARAVVFDGGNPYGGLIKAVAPRRDTRLVWVRRGMWRETQSNDEAIRRQRFFDLVIEPSDIAEAADKGATATNRSLALKVAPIRLLDEDELPDRAAAAAALGLDPERPAALIQLGAGSNRDIVSMVNTVLAELKRNGDVQPVLAEWLISPTQLDFWPGVRRLRGFPMSKYYHAFDFTVSAAGYNSFNEIISFGLPAIFLANDHATMDDQGGRARFAEENGAALHLPEHRVHAIGPMVRAMLDEKVRWLLKSNCLRIAQGNGAADAAQAIAQLV